VSTPDFHWRPVIAALANDRAREAFARLTLGASADEAFTGLSPSRRRHVVETLRAAGLITGDDDPRADGAALRRYLVNHDIVERTRSGTEYALVADAAQS
jgi:hypothetical protein